MNKDINEIALSMMFGKYSSFKINDYCPICGISSEEVIVEKILGDDFDN